MDRKTVLTFIGGTIVGLATGILATSTYWSKYWGNYHGNRADDEIDEMKLYYEKQNAELYSYFTAGDEVNPDKKEKEDQEENTETADADPEEEEKQRKAAEIKEKLIRNYEQTTNYATMYKNKEAADLDEENDPAESEHPEEDAVYDPENPADVAKDYTDDHAKNKHRKPVIISEDALGELPGYIEMETLFYYTYDEVITTEDDAPIDEPALLLGDCLDKYDFRESKESLIFVRNFAMDTVYEVQKIDAAYSGDGDEDHMR
jgi:hypothetical protein